MSIIWLNGAVLLLTLLGAAFYAGSETGFITLNPLKISHRASQGDLTARWAFFLMGHKDRVISAVLICNNACVIAATLAFLAIYEHIDMVIPVNLSKIPSPESWFLTPIIVLFAEMLPKTLFRTYSFRLTIRAVPIMIVTYYLTLPLTWFFSFLSKSFTRNPQEGFETFSTKVREEMVLIAEVGAKGGSLFESANVLIENVLSLRGKTAEDLMIPLDEWVKRYAPISMNSTIGDVQKVIADDEMIIFDDRSEIPVATISLVDIVSGDKNMRIKPFLKRIISIKFDEQILVCLHHKDKQIRYFTVIDKNGNHVGILDKLKVLHTAFSGAGPKIL